MAKNKQQHDEMERYLAREYLLFIGATVREISTLGEFLPNSDKSQISGPDVRAAIDFSGRNFVIGIELAEYHSDAIVQFGSPSKCAKEIGDKLRDRIREVHFKSFPILNSFEARIELNESRRPPIKSWNNLADEIVNFMIAHSPDITDQYCQIGGCCGESDFKGHSLLSQYVKSIWAQRRPPTANRRWQFGGASSFGLKKDQVASIIESKRTKSRNYWFDGTDESWLLIHATGGTSGSMVGPVELRDEFASPLLCDAVARSGFSRVIFWERTFNWDIDIPHAVLLKTDHC